jgi:hypothetical protein
MGRLNVKVVPGSSRDQIVGGLDDALKIKVTPPPEILSLNVVPFKGGRSVSAVKSAHVYF